MIVFVFVLVEVDRFGVDMLLTGVDSFLLITNECFSSSCSLFINSRDLLSDSSGLRIV